MKMEQNRISWSMAPGNEGGSMPKKKSEGDTPIEPRVSGDEGAHHRSTHRQRTLKAAKVVLTDWTTVDCTIRDISEDGARLLFGDAFALPLDFRILIVMSNTIVPAKLLWQRGLTAGVAFTGPEEPAPARKQLGPVLNYGIPRGESE
jgi:hypothetical protein